NQLLHLLADRGKRLGKLFDSLLILRFGGDEFLFDAALTQQRGRGVSPGNEANQRISSGRGSCQTLCQLELQPPRKDSHRFLEKIGGLGSNQRARNRVAQ